MRGREYVALTPMESSHTGMPKPALSLRRSLRRQCAEGSAVYHPSWRRILCAITWVNVLAPLLFNFQGSEKVGE